MPIGTRTVMETRFYGAIPGVTLIPSPGDELSAVHDARATMAIAGHVTDAQRRTFTSAGLTMLAAGAGAIMLGGTDLAFTGSNAPFPIIDCAAIHADAIAAFARTTP